MANDKKPFCGAPVEIDWVSITQFRRCAVPSQAKSSQSVLPPARLRIKRAICGRRLLVLRLIDL
jgi:hypothetical protein